MSKFRLILFAVCPIFIIGSAIAKERNNALFIAYDQIASPQKPVFLKVRLKTKSHFFSNPIGGERIEFFVDNRPIGVSLSGGDGIAVKEFTPMKEGIYKVRARLDERSGYSADEADMIIACWGKNRSIILIDLDTLTEEDFESEDSPDPAPDAPEVVGGLSKKYNIIIYTFDQDKRLHRKKEWLKRYSFPRLPLLSWPSVDIDDEVKNLIDYPLRLKFGIGNNINDIRAFSRNKMVPIIFINNDDKEDLPETTRKAKGWREIERIILGSLKDR